MATSSTDIPGKGSEQTSTVPLAGLHKMSTTAGVADQSYVAVNNTAVVAAVLGIASSLALFSPILLLIPAVGLIVAIVAFRQIRSSNGTQTGLLVAIAGGILSLGFGGVIASTEFSAHQKLRADGKQMDGIARQLGEALIAQKQEQAYSLFDSYFQARIKREQFDAQWNEILNQTSTGKLKSMDWNLVNPMIFDGESNAAHAEMGVASVNTQFEHASGRFIFQFIRRNGTWKILNPPEVFPEEKPKKKKPDGSEG